MKKILLISLLSFFSFFAAFGTDFSGDLLSRPHRVFEIGVDSDFTIANNLLSLEKILTKNVEIDLQTISDNLTDSGLVFALHDKEKVFIDLNISSRFRFSFFTDVESSFKFNIPKSLFDILDSGLMVGETKDFDMNISGDVFYDLGFSFQTIFAGYGVKLTPTYFIPLFYVPKTTATATFTTNSSGLILADANANVDIYTVIDMHDCVEDKKSPEIEVGELISKGGFDFSVEIERNWMHGLNAGFYTRIPLRPGTLDYKMSTKAWAYFYESNPLGYLNKTELHETKHGYAKPSTYGTENEEEGFDYSEDSYKAYRPLKFGLNATYMPWGQWFKIQPALGFAVRNPYTSDAEFYMEYALDLRFSVLRRFLNVNLGTAYQNQIFQHSFGLGLNIRAMEILTQVSMCGTSFLSTFHTAGYGVFAGFRIGF